MFHSDLNSDFGEEMHTVADLIIEPKSESTRQRFEREEKLLKAVVKADEAQLVGEIILDNGGGGWFSFKYLVFSMAA